MDRLLLQAGSPDRPAGNGAAAAALRLLRRVPQVCAGLVPRTMTGLMAAGCLLAAAPLLLALLLIGAQLDQLARRGEQLVSEGLEVVRLGSQLRDNVSDLERAVRQYSVLGDPSLAASVADRLGQAEATLGAIEDQQSERIGGHVYAAQRELVQIAKAWTAGQAQPESLPRLAARIHALGAEADAIVASGRGAIDSQVDNLRQAGAEAHRVLLVSLLALIPLTTLLAFAFAVVVMRPLRQMRRGIADLGHARYDRDIVIRFPREMRRLGEQLDWLRRRLVQLEADKERFLRHVSHELKTPLASLHEGVALLGDGSLGPLSAPQREVAEILRESTTELDGQIHNLLGYARWRFEREHSALEWFEAEALAREAEARCQWLLRRRDLRLELRVRGTRLFGHRTQLRLALDNLLGNAIKHAPPGSAIDLELGCAQGRCELSLRDRGRGVAQHEKRIIFEPFVRGTEQEEAGTRGTGIGLSIVQETILSHNGTIEVEDAAPGARFKLSWPCPHEPA